MSDKVFITCAITGSSPLPDHPTFPYKPEDLAAQGLAAAEAGASILHIHVRDPETGAPSTELEHYRQTINLIREKNNEVILNVTSGPGCMWFPSDEDHAMPGAKTQMFTAAKRLEHILDLKAEMCTLDICTMNLWGGVAMNLLPVMKEMGAMIRDVGAVPEIECFEAGDFVYADDLMAMDVIPKTSPFSFVLGTKYGLPATPEAMMYSKNQIPRGNQFTGFGISRHSYPMAAQSVLLGGNVRVGFEDTIYLRKGKKAETNADLVTWGVELIDRLGKDVATAGETRALLGLKQ